MDTSKIEDFLECSICLEQLDERHRVLPCQHTFCMKCLSIILESMGYLRCPECRSPFRDLSLNDLPRNVLLIRILEGLKTKRNSTTTNDTSPVTPTQNKQDICRTTSSEDLRTSKRLSAKVKCEALLNQPSARGLYNFTSNENGDLSFVKGDVITLMYEIDENWIEGILKGKRGSIPKNFVEILVPLPKIDDDTNETPFARALYTFESKEEQELISFKEGDMIPIIKKVDDNWLEGVLGSQYGIFPVNFMKLNKAAQVLMNAECPSGSGNTSSSDDDNENKQKRASERSTRANKSASSSQRSPKQQQQLSIDQPQPTGHLLPSASAVDQTKRHTIHLANPQEHRKQSRRALNLSDEIDPQQRDRTQSQGRRSSESAIQQAANQQERSPASSVLLERALRNDHLTCSIPPTVPVSMTASISSRTDMILTFSTAPSSGIHSPGASETYTALFTYSPAQDDELALIQGDQYIVVEKHLNGWYKGIHVRSRQSGVFPGNYVKLSSQVTSQMLRSSNSSRNIIVYGSNPSSPSAITGTTNAFNFPARDVEIPSTSPSLVSSTSSPSRRSGDGSSPSKGSGFGLLKILKKSRSKRRTPPQPATPTSSEQSPPSYYHSSMPAPAHHRLSRPCPIVPTEPPPPYTPTATEQTTAPIFNTNISAMAEKFRVVVNYEGAGTTELSLKVGDLIYVTKKQDDGWYTGTSSRTGECGVFPSTFVEPLE